VRPEWILAACAVATLIGGMAIAWAYVVSGLRVLRTQVDSLNREIALIVQTQARLESLLLSLLRNFHPLEPKAGESHG
jgi:hypothetical protein